MVIPIKQGIEIFLKDKHIATIDLKSGNVDIINPKLLPVNLNLCENPKEISDYVQNIDNFRTWCASRTLMMSQKHAKLICNALNLSQVNSNENKAKIAMVYHCSTLLDSYWIREIGSTITFDKVSLFQNKSRNILTPISLLGKTESLFNKKLKNWSDLGVDGTLAKSWVRENNTYYLYKTGDNLSGETLASKILDQISANHVSYDFDTIDDTNVVKSKCFTNEVYSFIPYSDFVSKYDLAAISQITSKFMEEYANMVVACYITGNEDLHQGNWGLLRNNDTGEITGLAPLFDFDGCFLNYYSSKNLYFLPEARFLLENGVETAINNFDIDLDYDIVGPTIEEAAFKYAPYCSLNLDGIIINDIPEKYREELQKRCQLIIEKQKNILER